MTAVAGSAFTAADFNTFIRDNLNETAVAKATTAGRIFVSTGLNSLAERAVAVQTNNTQSTTTSTTYDDLSASTGPVVTTVTGSSAMVFFGAQMRIDTAGQLAYMSVYVSGVSTVSASDNWSLTMEQTAVNAGTGGASVVTGDIGRASSSFMFTGLTPGTNNFGCQYRVTGGTATIEKRHIFVIPL
jgi:hypothetical protein